MSAQNGKRDKANVIFNSSIDVIFIVKKYAEALTKVVQERNIQVNFRRELIEVKPESKEAVFQLLDQPMGTTETYKVRLSIIPQNV